jgi:hypothetical protein
MNTSGQRATGCEAQRKTREQWNRRANRWSAFEPEELVEIATCCAEAPFSIEAAKELSRRHATGEGEK